VTSGDDDWLPILEYRDFYDVPHVMLVASHGRFLVLWGPFDDALDDYAADYSIYELASDPRLHFGADWSGLPATGTLLGRVPVDSITFDPSRRQALKSDRLAEFLE
jgi:hypothetical protein